VNFEEHRPHLRGVAYRMLGSRSEADDAVQDAWLKASKANSSTVENPRGWLTTIVARVCLDMLRSRTSRREAALEAAPELAVESPAPSPQFSAAVLVILDKLEPAERIAFVLHDVVAMPFEEIAPIVGKSVAATRQLASRARRRVQGAEAPELPLPTQRRIVDAFIAAMRSGDIEALVSVLGGNREWAQGAIQFAKAAASMRPVLVEGLWIGLAFAPGGTINRVLLLDFDSTAETVLTAEIITDPEALAVLSITDLS
jgi:RNA polymerase sigma-70 factor (ECF subfamily)